MSWLAPYVEQAGRALASRVRGRVATVVGLTLWVEDLPLPVGALVRVEADAGRVLGQVVGFDGGRAAVMLLGQAEGVREGDAVEGVRAEQTALVGRALVGRCVDALGRSLDGGGPIAGLVSRPLLAAPIGALRREPIRERLATGVRALDLFATLGRGQRLGIFAGPGVGKSTLLGQIARHTEAEVSVIALVGERGREVREFVEDTLGAAGLSRSVVVVATGDEPPLMRLRAARYACAVAEHFRDEGRHVLLVMDSLTRFAHAQRQVGLSVGEPPATKGYTPSVFTALGLLLERAGAVTNSDGSAGGSVTGLYTVLVEGDDLRDDPIADAARGILDGHVVLSRAMAQRGWFPAVDVLDSVSRVADRVTDGAMQAARRQVAGLLAEHRRVAELVEIGAYAKGSNARADVALEAMSAIEALLRQGVEEHEAFDEARSRLIDIGVRTGEAIRLRVPTGGRAREAA